MSEMAKSRTVMLDSTWDCKIHLNVNDFDLQPEMKGRPAIQEDPTEALFAVVRNKVGGFHRHTPSHFRLTTPAQKPIAKHLQNGKSLKVGELVKLCERIEDQNLKFCDLENQIQFTTSRTT